MNEKREYSLKKENTHFSKRITQNKENHSIPMKDKPNGMRMVRKSQASRTRITITSTQRQFLTAGLKHKLQEFEKLWAKDNSE